MADPSNAVTSTFELSPRASVFDGPSDMVYLGIDQTYVISGEGRFAICGARANRSFPNRRVAAADVPVELRGTGNCSRQVHNFGTAGVFEADSLMAVEVITPGGNWSSYPAHKHDENTPVESALEEIYYFEIAGGPDGSRGFGYHRVYGTPDRPIEVLEEVRTGDVVLVPHGFHGPSVAAPGYHMYYLNVMAGPGAERAWKIVDDPEHAWLRGTWEDQAVDPRLPLHDHRSLTVVSTAPKRAEKTPDTESTVRLTVAQATIRFLANQYVERDGERTKFFAGAFGIFGHGNVAGLGQALLQDEVEAVESGTEPGLRYVLGRNEQAMVHSAVAYARQKDRLQTWAVTASVGPGSTNMLTGAALATINRLPVMLLPADTFATRVSAPVLQELELPSSGDVTVNDAFKPLSRYFDRVWRPEQLPAALLGAMRVLTDPVETGAATVSIPQDVQAEAHYWPESLFAERTWHVARPLPEPSVIARAAEVIRTARKPLIVVGGGVVYSGATDALAAFCERTGIPVGMSQAGKGALPYDHPQCVGAIGSTGTTAANALATEADVVIGIGTRYSDFTSASRTAFNNPDVKFVNINVASLDSVKQGGVSVVADAREAIDALGEALGDYRVADDYRARTAALAQEWDDTVSAVYRVDDGAALNQNQVIGLANTLVRSARRGGVRSRLDARRSAQTLAYQGSQGLPRRVRLLLHGLRGGRRARGQDGRSQPRCVRHGGRRLLSDDGHRTGDRRARGHQGHRGAGAEPRLRVDRIVVGGAGLPAIRHRLPLPQRRRSARRRQATRRPRRQRGQPGRRRRQSRDGRGVQRRREGRQGQRPHHGDPRRNRPTDSRTGQ